MNFKSCLSNHRIFQVLAIVGSFAAIYWLRKYQNSKVIEIPEREYAFLDVTNHIFTSSCLSSIDLKLWIQFLSYRNNYQQTLQKWENFIEETILKQSSIDKFKLFISNIFLSDIELIKNYKANLNRSLNEITKFNSSERAEVINFSNSNKSFVSRFVYIYRRFVFINELETKNKSHENVNYNISELALYHKEFDCYKEGLKLSITSNNTESHDLQSSFKSSEMNIPKSSQLENVKRQGQRLPSEFLLWSNYSKRMQV